MTDPSRNCPRLCLTVLRALLLLLASCGKPGPRRNLYLYFTSADKTHYSFLYGLSEKENVLVVYSDREWSIGVYKTEVGHVWPATMLDDGSFLVPQAPNINPPFTPAGLRSVLYKCAERRCKALLAAELGFSSMIGMRDGSILLAASPPGLFADHWSWSSSARFVKYHDYDLYSFRPGSDLRKLTAVHAIGIGSLSAGGNILALQMTRTKSRLGHLLRAG